MSTIGGIFYPNSTPLDIDVLRRFCLVLERRGFDSTDTHNECPIVLFHCKYITNPYNTDEKIEHLVKSGKYLVWDGRLDNRDDISRSLNSRGDTIGDSIRVLDAIETWGTEVAFQKMIGDWALAIWDSRKQTVYLARDYAGVRPLYYTRWQNIWIWASDIEAILEITGYEQDIEVDYLSGLFSIGPNIATTPFKGIYAVPPGAFVTLTANSRAIFHYWDYAKIEPVRYRSEREYEEQFRYLLKKAVRRRLNSDDIVCAHLSGGLDSSAIVCLADEIINEGLISTRKLETISHIYDDSDTGERTYISEIEKQRKQLSHYLHIKDFPPLQPFIDQPAIPCFSNAFWQILSAQSRLMSDLNSRVLISGIGGDEISGNTRNAAACLIRQLEQGREKGWLRNLLAWSRVQRRPLWEIILETISEGGKHLKLINNNRSLAPWLNDGVGSYARSAHSRLSMLSVGFASAVVAIGQHQHRIWCGSEISYPYLDRDFVYFCHSIPITQLIRPGEPRSLMRRALSDLLPQRIVKRRSKNLPAKSLCQALERELPRLEPMFDHLKTTELGLISRELLLPAIQRMRHGAEEFIGALVMLIVIEEWLQRVTNNTTVSSTINNKERR